MITPQSLVELERRFAPTVGAAPAVFSVAERTRTDRMNAGGDKMAADRNNYAAAYAGLLSGLNPAVVVELGVFQGVSMAMWCDLFPEAFVVGLDLDFDRFHACHPSLVGRGAFRRSSPALFTFDAYQQHPGNLSELPPVDLFIDDGPHTEEAIVNVLRLVGPLMAEGGVYVIEDFPSGGDLLAEAFPDAHIVYAGKLNAARL
jgi:cephalosporin hydroxylase